MALPSLETLRCFAVAARAPSFREAAKELALTPAAVGQRIKSLEDQLGARLFERTTRSVSLTEAGLSLLPRANEALAAAARCLEPVQGKGLMELTVGTRHELGMSFLLPLREKIRERHPELLLHYHYGSGSELLLRLRLREIDCAVTSSRLADPLLDAFELHREDYVLCGAPGLLRRVPFERLADAAAHTLIDISEELPLFGYWRASLKRRDVRFNRVLRAGSIAPIRQLVLDEEGVAVLPLYFVQRELDRGALVRVLPEVVPSSDHFRLVFRADDARRSVYEALSETLRSEPLR